MKKFYIISVIPIANFFVARIWYYYCVKNKIPFGKQFLRGIIASVSCLVTAMIIGYLSAVLQTPYINYGMLYLLPLVLDLVLIFLGRNDITE